MLFLRHRALVDGIVPARVVKLLLVRIVIVMQRFESNSRPNSNSLVPTRKAEVIVIVIVIGYSNSGSNSNSNRESCSLVICYYSNYDCLLLYTIFNVLCSH